MKYWLMKSEPEAFSIDDLRKQRIAGWDGVRNYQARNFMRAMRRGNQAFFYHSSVNPPAIVGVMEIVRESYPDPTDPRWDQVDVKFMRVFERPLSLEEIRGIPALKDMVLLKRGRLSVQPVSSDEWRVVLSKAQSPAGV
jgi:predicted RNA-binding protein with PUA-like domain